MVLFLIDFLVSLLFILDINGVHLGLKNHILIELIIGIHEGRGEILVHHFFNSHASKIFASGRFIFDGFQLDMVKVCLNFKFEFFRLVDD